MDKVYKDHIIKNIVRLIDCTQDPVTWYHHQIPHGFISHSTWQTINKQQPATDSMIREMYFACMKTPKYDDLIKCLKSSGNNSAAEILEEVYTNNAPAGPSTFVATFPAQVTDFRGVRSADIVDDGVHCDAHTATKIEESSEFMSKYTSIECVGKSGDIRVYKCNRNYTEGLETVAVKLIPIDSLNLAEKVIRGETKLKELRHKNIVRFHGHWLENPIEGYKYPDATPITNSTVGVVFVEMEYCDKGNLVKWLNNSKRTKEQGQRIMYELTEGVYYLHSQNVTQRDIKPENIMLCSQPSSDSVTVKICDFGISRDIKTKMAGKGTFQYMAPEGKTVICDKTADIYSLGIVFWAILTLGNKDYSQTKSFETKVFFDSIFATPRFQFTTEANDFLNKASLGEEKLLIAKMIDHTPEERPDAFEVLKSLREMYPGVEKSSIRIPA